MAATMRALAKTAPGPGLTLIDAPIPQPGPGEVRIKVLRAGLCGTDLHLYTWDEWAASVVRTPLILGHEFCGRIDALGAGVAGLSEGALVSGEGHIVCGQCRNCRAGRRHLCINTVGIGVNRDGAFADYVVLPATNVWQQPADLDPAIGALFDPFGNATHTALSFPMAGEDVLITGAGPIGVMATAIARHVGARFIVVTDLNPTRLDLARAAGADLAIHPEELRSAMTSLGMKEGFDVGLEMSGAPPAVEAMLATMNHGGRVAMLGLPSAAYAIDWGRLITHMITIKGIYGREMYDTWYAMSSMLQSSPRLTEALGSVITHRLPASAFEEAFAAIGSGDCGKVILDWEDI